MHDLIRSELESEGLKSAQDRLAHLKDVLQTEESNLEKLQEQKQTAQEERIGITQELPIWMVTAIGCMSRDMGMSGSRISSQEPGRPIRLEDGFGKGTMAGHGYLTSHGAGPLIITEDGFFMRTLGAGGLVRFMPDIVRCGRRHLYSS